MIVSPDGLLTPKLQSQLKACLRTTSGTEEHLAGAVSHALTNPGSMMRARLCYRIARNFRVADECAADLAISVELFHTASLLFDDLPCMDDADERRGAPCAHKLFGEGTATLAALALVNKAYALLWKALQKTPLCVRTQCASFVERCLGLEGILNGQSYDLQFRSREFGATSVMRVAIGKTVSLIRMALVLPAMLGGASEIQVATLNRLSVYWGLAYQITDDLKDVLKSSAQARKTTQRDALLGRPNIALAEGPARTSQILARLIYLGETTLERASEQAQLFSILKEYQRRAADEFLETQQAAA
ncbi:MAG: polyprenyl synthetase family protein [Limisphaerales bacterium]